MDASKPEAAMNGFHILGLPTNSPRNQLWSPKTTQGSGKDSQPVEIPRRPPSWVLRTLRMPQVPNISESCSCFWACFYCTCLNNKTLAPAASCIRLVFHHAQVPNRGCSPSIAVRSIAAASCTQLPSKRANTVESCSAPKSGCA